MPIITLAEARQQLNYADDDINDDTEIQAYVNGITAVVERYKDEVIDQRTIVEDLSLKGDCEFWLSYSPVISLTSLISLDGATTWSLTNLRARPDGHVKVLLSGPAPWGETVATYQAGYTTVPENYKRGALIMLEHLWSPQRGAGLGGGGVVGPGETFDLGPIPPKAMEWLDPRGTGYGGFG